MKQQLPWLASVELTNRCNARCLYCPKQYSPRKECDMPFDLYKNIVNSPFLKEIHPELIGEPLLYPQIVDAVAYAKKKGKRVLMYTNASLLDPQMAEQLLEVGLDEIRFSVDECDQSRFESLRPGLSWETVLFNIESFQKLKQKERYHTITVARSTVTKENEARMNEIKKFWTKRVDAFFSIPEVNTPSPSAIIQRKWTSGTPIKNCDKVHYLAVKSNGDVVLCCRDWYGLYIMGNLYENSIATIFNSEQFSRTRTAMEQGKNYPILCDYCRQPPTRL